MIAALAMMTLPSPDPAEWGREALDMIRREYYLPRLKLYSERADKQQPAFNWGVGVMLSALNAAAKHDEKYKPWLREFADATRVYWNDGGYDVLPAPKPKDRYYDDNAWMALALLETHEVLGDAKYLSWAKGALDFALKGLAKDGGVYWRESDRASRNTCSCAPTAAACLALGGVYEAQGKAIFDWTSKNLQDPADKLFWDSLSNRGRIDKTKWTYNTALMIRAADKLGAESLEPMTDSSKARWLKGGKIADPGRFAHLLLEAWIRAEGLKPSHVSAVEAVYRARNPKGFFPSNWADLKIQENPEILDQAAFARACFMLTLAEGNKGAR